MQLRGNRPVLAAGAALALLMAGGCSRIHEHQGFLFDQIIVDSVAPGIDNKDSVQSSLGHPTFASQFGPERWYYVSRQTKSLAFGSPRPEEQELVMIAFDAKGNVTTVDKNATLAQVALLSPVGAKTPTLGRKRSLFGEIFGNIGAVGALGGAGGAGPEGGGPGGPNGS